MQLAIQIAQCLRVSLSIEMLMLMGGPPPL
jgi:hypothetical protein